MTSESEQVDMNQFFKEITVMRGEQSRLEYILNRMHENRKFNGPYDQFALKICEKINQCKPVFDK